MIRAKSKIIKVLLLIAVILTATLGSIYIGESLAPQDSSALFGGKLESGYEFAGYSIAYQGNKLTTCGATFINPSTVVTAAHCIPNESELYVGFGDFKENRDDNIAVSSFVINPGWSGRPENDIAILNLIRNVELSEYATTQSPSTGCNYEIVGYGQNETSVPGDFTTKLRKSIQVCIENVIGDIAYLKGSDGGICYGDSGSPVFERSTNRFVGVVSSIVATSASQSSYCAINNIGAIVLPQNYQNFILSSQFTTSNQLAASGTCGSSCVTQSDCSDGLTCISNRCSLSGPTTSCTAPIQAFCSQAIGVSCANGANCIGKTCVATSDLIQAQASDVFESINPAVVAALLAGVIFTILILLVIPSKRY